MFAIEANCFRCPTDSFHHGAICQNLEHKKDVCNRVSENAISFAFTTADLKDFRKMGRDPLSMSLSYKLRFAIQAARFA